jgi:CheY-like chemotaxis protein
MSTTPDTTGSHEPALDPDAVVPLDDATILLVDDNLQNLELMQAYLDDLPSRVVTASDGVEAMEAVDREKPDLILLDVMMPRMSGFEVCQKLKANPQTREVIIVMVTALNEVPDYERAVESGTDDFLSKPVNKLELLTRVKSLLRVRLLRKKLDALLEGQKTPRDS